MRYQGLSLVLLPLLALSCKGDKESSSDKEKAKEGVAAVLPGTASTAAKAQSPYDASGNDTLWALAPEGTTFGMVAAAGSGSRTHQMIGEILKVVEARPIGKEGVAKMRTKATSEIGVDIFDAEALKKNGLDLNLGAALFVVPNPESKDDEKDWAYGVFPVSDRVAFRKMAKGEVETIKGVEYDRYKDNLVCIPKLERYLCGKDAESLATFGKSVGSSFAKRVSGLAPEYRGHFEAVMDVPAMAKAKGDEEDLQGEFAEYFSDPGLGVVAMRLERGAVTARLWFEAKPVGVVAAAAEVSKALSKAAVAENPGGLWSMRIPPVAWEKGIADKEDKELPGGLSLKNDIFGNITGEILMYTGSGETMWGRLAIGLKDAAPFKSLLNMGCGMAPAMGVPGITITPGDGTCDAVIDVSKLPLPSPEIAKIFPEPITVKAEAKDKQFSLTVGKVSAGAKNGISASGTEFLTKDWNMSVWMGKVALGPALHAVWPKISSIVPPKELEGVKMGVWVASHLNEFGYAGAVRDDGVHFVFHVGTYAADSDEAYAAYQAAVVASMDSQKDTFAALSEKYPNSLAGKISGPGGSVMIAGIVGAMAAVAIPAFVKYTKRSKEMRDSMLEMDGLVEGGILDGEKKEEAP